jgi:hypothetical protein
MTKEPNCLECGEPQPHPGAHFDGMEFTCAETPPQAEAPLLQPVSCTACEDMIDPKDGYIYEQGEPTRYYHRGCEPHG